MIQAQTEGKKEKFISAVRTIRRAALAIESVLNQHLDLCEGIKHEVLQNNLSALNNLHQSLDERVSRIKLADQPIRGVCWSKNAIARAVLRNHAEGKPLNSGIPWSAEESIGLSTAYAGHDAGLPLKTRLNVLARKFQRGNLSILLKLLELELISEDDYKSIAGKSSPKRQRNR